VEGVNDVRAVRAAVHPTLGFAILKGTYDNKSGHHVVPADVIRELSDAVRAGGRVVVLTDPDVAGRQLRSRVVQQVPGARHAFLGAHETTAARDTKHHKAGNVGVEHAAPEAIRRALDRARPAASEGGSSGVSRAAFDKSRLAEWGLCAAPGEAAPEDRWRAFGGVAARRRLVGERLGVGDCDAKQLIRQLNLFFEEEEVAEAIDALPGEGEPVPEKMTDGRADRARGRGGDEEPEFDLYAYVPPGQAPPGFR
jgi:ribonuclease M5